MNKKKILISAIILIVVIVGIALGFMNKESQVAETSGTDENQEGFEQDTGNGEQESEEMNEDSEIKEIEVSTENEEKDEPKEEINTLKENTGKTGDTDLYEIQEGDNNIKIATIKSSVKYKVAFAGMLENKAPEMSKLDNILQEKHPKYAGIWIYEKDRDDVLEMLKQLTKSEYKIDENGYLKIVNKNNQNENDQKLEKNINGENLYIIRNSSTCYIVDEITGEILDYNFEKLDRYQTYEYFQDDDKMIIFMNENTKKQMTSKEIMQSVIDLF